MIISELIEQLQGVMDSHGDVEVVVRSEEFDFEPLKFVDSIQHESLGEEIHVLVD